MRLKLESNDIYSQNTLLRVYIESIVANFEGIQNDYKMYWVVWLDRLVWNNMISVFYSSAQTIRLVTFLCKMSLRSLNLWDNKLNFYKLIEIFITLWLINIILFYFNNLEIRFKKHLSRWKQMNMVSRIFGYESTNFVQFY